MQFGNTLICLSTYGVSEKNCNLKLIRKRAIVERMRDNSASIADAGATLAHFNR